MARVITSPELARVNIALAERLVSLRTDFCGTRGGPEVARRLQISSRTWHDYERGVTVPGEILLKVIETFDVEPLWLIHREGPRFGDAQTDREITEISPAETTSTRIALSLLRLALKMLENAEPAPLPLETRRWGHASVRGKRRPDQRLPPNSPLETRRTIT